MLFKVKNQIKAPDLDTWVSSVEKTSDAFANVISLINAKGKPVVVFIDDLDRCLPESVIKLLEQLKHISSNESKAKIVFVLGVDKKSVQNAIRTRYAQFSEIEANSYLEKIINFNIDLPECRKEQFELFLKAQTKKLNIAKTELPDDIAMILVSGRMHNLRKVHTALRSFHLIKETYADTPDFTGYTRRIFIFCLLKEFWPNAYKDILTSDQNNIFWDFLLLSQIAPGERKTALSSNSKYNTKLTNYLDDNDLFLFSSHVSAYFPDAVTYPTDQINQIIIFCQLIKPVTKLNA